MRPIKTLTSLLIVSILTTPNLLAEKEKAVFSKSDLSPHTNTLTPILGVGHSQLLYNNDLFLGKGAFGAGGGLDYHYAYRPKGTYCAFGFQTALYWVNFVNTYDWGGKTLSKDYVDINGSRYTLFQQMNMVEKQESGYLSMSVLLRFDFFAKGAPNLSFNLGIGGSAGFCLSSNVSAQGDLYRYAYFPDYHLTVDESEVLPLGHQEINHEINSKLSNKYGLIAQFGMEYRFHKIAAFHFSLTAEYTINNLKKSNKEMVSLEPYYGISSTNFIKTINASFFLAKIGITFYL